MQKTSKLSLAVMAGIAGLGLAFATVSPAVAAGTQYVCVSKTNKLTVRTKCVTGEKKLFTVPTSIVGPAGAAGATGPAGPAGPAGATGATGATGPAGAPGATGPAGAAGPQGPQGEPGLQGTAGLNGVDGAQGPAGADGLPGAQGPQGIQGPAGPAGADGANGLNGTNGVDGVDGVGYTNAVDGDLCSIDVDGVGPNAPLAGVIDIAETAQGNGIYAITCVVTP